MSIQQTIGQGAGAELAPVGSVISLRRYPVKSMMGEELEAAYLNGSGLLGDRAYAVIDCATGKVASAKNPRKWPTLFGFKASYCAPPRPETAIPPVTITLPDGASIRSDSLEVTKLLASALAREVALKCGAAEKVTLEEYWPDMDDLAHRDMVTDEAMPAQTFFDCAPVHIVTTATLTKLAELYPGGQFDSARFRPNILISTGSTEAWFIENTWVGRTIAIGPEVELKITGDTGRCIMTTLAQGGLPRDLSVLKTAVQHNQGRVGVYATVVKGGTVRHSDVVRV